MRPLFFLRKVSLFFALNNPFRQKLVKNRKQKYVKSEMIVVLCINKHFLVQLSRNYSLMCNE